MSMETFQNVDDWLVSTDVSSVLTACWKEEEPDTGLDDDTAGVGGLTSPCSGDGFEWYNITDCLNSPVQNCWLDINEVLPWDNKASAQFFAGCSDGDVLASECGFQICDVEARHEQLPEVSVSEMEALLRMHSKGEIASGHGQPAVYVTVDPNDLESVRNNTITKLDFDHQVMEEEPVTPSCDVDEDEDLSSEEDDNRDVTWSYRAHTTRSRRCRGRRRSRPSRRLSLAGNIVADEQKKQQNKSAATRYREKKRTEEVENELLCAELEKQNKELRTRVQDMTQQVSVLRQLVVDIFRTPNVCTA